MKALSFVVGVAVLALSSSIARADLILINDLGEPVVTATCPGCTGTLVAQNNGNENLVVPAWLYTLPAGTVWTSAAIFFADFTEPPGSDDPAGTLSDRYVITQQFNGIANQALIQYDSDPIALQVPTGAIPTGFSGVEAGAFQVVDVATNRDNGFTLVVEAASDVPEPSLILPLGASVVFLTTIARRKRRQIV